MASVTVRAGNALNDLMESQAAQMIGHLAGREGARRYSQEVREAVAQMADGEPSRQVRKRQQGGAQGLDLGVGEA